MVIQPVTVARGTAAQGQCHEAEATTICYACKCCKVKTDGDPCGCCGGAKDEGDNCCGNKAVTPEYDHEFGEIAVVLPEPFKASKSADADNEQIVGEPSAISSCLCGIRSEPIAPAPYRVPVLQSRDLVLIGYLDHAAMDAGYLLLRDRLAPRLPIGDLSPHFSQRFLCVWRI